MLGKSRREDAEEGMCGLAFKSLYGFLDAASCWNDEVGNMLVENGFHVGKANPACTDMRSRTSWG